MALLAWWRKVTLLALVLSVTEESQGVKQHQPATCWLRGESRGSLARPQRPTRHENERDATEATKGTREDCAKVRHVPGGSAD